MPVRLNPEPANNTFAVGHSDNRTRLALLRFFAGCSTRFLPLQYVTLRQLPNGDLVRLAAIEEVVLSSPLVAQVYVTVVRSALVAIVHPDERYVRRAASRQGNRLQGDLTDMQSTCSSDAFKEAALNEILRVTRKAKLPAHARICAVVLAPSCFSRENGLIDAEGGSMRRESIKKRFKSQLIQASREA